jgi:glycosyltransferase involved in cell wall biosynthesis
MRIAIFTNNYLPNPYGVAGSVESFRKVFEKLDHEVYVFAPRWKDYADKNPRVFRYPSIDIEIKIKFPLAIPHSLKIHKILKRLKLDIIHSQHPNLLGSAAAHWACRKNIPLVFTWHTLYDQYAHFVPFVPRRLAAWWAIRNARNYANRADAVITPTPSVIEIIKHWGVKNKNIFSVPTGVDEEQFANPDGESARKKYGVKNDEILLLMITRLTAEKNVEFLFEAISDILARNEKVKFLTSGEGHLRNKLEKMIKKKNLKDKIIFAEEITNENKKNYYAAGDIFVFASKSETQGMVLTEAMYCGLPIVAVRATGDKDIVEDGKTGFLVSENKKEFADAVQRLIDNADLRREFEQEAKRIAGEKYTSKVCGEKMLKIYEKTIANYK